MGGKKRRLNFAVMKHNSEALALHKLTDVLFIIRGCLAVSTTHELESLVGLYSFVRRGSAVAYPRVLKR